MATKKKIKPEPKQADPVLHTWAVNIDGQLTNITALAMHTCGDGAIAFFNEDVVVRAVAPGHWATVELIGSDEQPPQI